VERDGALVVEHVHKPLESPVKKNQKHQACSYECDAVQCSAVRCSRCCEDETRIDQNFPGFDLATEFSTASEKSPDCTFIYRSVVRQAVAQRPSNLPESA
jgi:hypothetical protein